LEAGPRETFVESLDQAVQRFAFAFVEPNLVLDAPGLDKLSQALIVGQRLLVGHHPVLQLLTLGAEHRSEVFGLKHISGPGSGDQVVVMGGGCAHRHTVTAEMRIGDPVIMVSEVGEREIPSAFQCVYVDDADSTNRAVGTRSGNAG
jgi:hypothetical protein